MPKAVILVIEDNRDILDAIRLLLEQGGFSVITAEDSLTALDCLAQHCPDLILTDLMMPEMTGLEFIHHLRRISDYDRVPIIAMSAFDSTYLAAAIVAGAVTALRKPEEIGALVEAVEEALASSHKAEAAQGSAQSL